MTLMWRREPQNLTWALVTGCARSGTTLLCELINQHPGAAILHEVGLNQVAHSLAKLSSVIPLDVLQVELEKTRAARRVADDATDSDARNAIELFYKNRPVSPISSFAAYGETNMTLLNNLARGYFSTLYPNKVLSTVGDKMPGLGIRDIENLESILGDLRLVFTIRHPIDTISSSMRRAMLKQKGLDDWDLDSVQDAISHWVSTWNTMAAVYRTSAKPICVVEYSRLCNKPQQQIDRVFSFLDLPSVELIWKPQTLPSELTRQFLTESDLHAINDQLGNIISSWNGAEPIELLGLYPRINRSLHFNTKVQFNSLGSNRDYLTRGFSGPEPHGTWTDGSVAQIQFQHRAIKTDLLIELWLVDAVFDPEGLCHFTVTANNSAATLFRLETAPKTISMLIPASALDVTGNTIVTIKVARPKDKSDGPDPRELGICLQAMRVTAF